MSDLKVDLLSQATLKSQLRPTQEEVIPTIVE